MSGLHGGSDLKLIAKIADGLDEDGVNRWSTIVENADTNIPMCHLIWVDFVFGSESNAQQIYGLLNALLLLHPSLAHVFDLSLWPQDLT